MQASLATLVSNLTTEKMKHCSTLGWPQELIKAKGVFPYSWLDSAEKLNAVELPPIEAFYDTLCQNNISESDYKRAQSAWDDLHCTTMRDYMLEYLRLDVH